MTAGIYDSVLLMRSAVIDRRYKLHRRPEVDS
jgi:hypothetical protein